MDHLTAALKGRRILVTGHTGFKGVWLCQMLEQIGAHVAGVALEPETSPHHFGLVKWAKLKDIRGDIRNGQELKSLFHDFKPEVVIHMAAQSLVRPSYEDPVTTYETNVMGTLHVLEAARATSSVKACVSVTSDKCYENKETRDGYKETDPMGGHDPYSSSKGCAELLVSSYRRSYLNDGGMLLASVRAGNVIGGGDWSKDRLLPDLLSNAFKGQTVLIRNPEAIRPWQHVLEALHGYLKLTVGLLAGRVDWATGWNFGPEISDCVSVRTIVEEVSKLCPDLRFEMAAQKQGPHEAGLLFLNTDKAKSQLGWKPNWKLQKGLEQTVKWYEQFYRENTVATEQQIEKYLAEVSP